MALSPEEQTRVWEGLYTSEVRIHYYAYLSIHYQRVQTFLTWLTLVLSGGAAATFVAKLSTDYPWLPTWIPAALSLLTAAFSAYSLVAKNERKGIDSSKLSQRYAEVALSFDKVFRRMEAATSDELEKLETEEAKLGEPAHSLAYIKRLMRCAESDVKKARKLKS
jgi:hypothetical protein